MADEEDRRLSDFIIGALDKREAKNMADTDTPPVKPGYATTEFWLTAVVTLIGLLVASGAIPTESSWGKLLGLAASALASMGYSASRATVKANQ